jgi:uncharacterized protein (DUF924 family)
VTKPQDVLDFWFGAEDDSKEVRASKVDMWFGGGPEVDTEITDRFAETLKAAAKGELDAWADEAKSRLALIIVLDQFSRNIHRGKKDAFATDKKAVELTRSGIADWMDQTLSPIERVFFYMPLEHAEDRIVQRKSVKLFTALVEDAARLDPGLKPVFELYLDFAKKHADIVEQFGRFPHRNDVLGRESTDEEKTYLKEGGETFGS